MPQTIDVRIDVALITFVLGAPHLVEQIVARPGTARFAGEPFENLEFKRREFDGRAFERHLVAALVDHEASDLDALRRLVEFTFDHHHQHEEFIRMVMIENIHHGEFLERSGVIRDLNVTAIGNIEAIYAKGLAEGLFRSGLDPLEIHWQISALCFFNVSNRATFSKIFGKDVGSPDYQSSLRRQTVEMVLRFVVRADKLGAE